MRKVVGLLLALLVVGAASLVSAAGPEDTWKIKSPANGADVKGPDVTVSVDPGQMKIAPPGAVVAGEGHWHFLMDGKDVAKGPTNDFVFKGLTAGKHVLRVELHKGDHSPFGNGQEVTVNVSLPNTGANVALYIVAGLVMVAAGGYLFTRKGKAVA